MRRFVMMVGALLALTGGAFGQGITLNNVSGNECWNAGQGPGGINQGYLCINLVRNGSSLTIVSGSGAVATQATANTSALYWSGAAPTSWTITTPVTPFDGQILELGTDTTLATMVTLTANTGQTLNTSYSAQTLNANSSVEYRYSASATKWYRAR